MKKKLVLLSAVTTLIASGAVYPTTFVVTETNVSTDTIYLRNANGNVYAYYGIEDWEPGDIAAAIMWSNGTETIQDDAILTLRYNGNADDFQ